MNENYERVDGMKSFSGSIDELLQQSMKLDPNVVEQQVDNENYDIVIANVMKMFSCDYSEAEFLYQEAKNEMVQKGIDTLIAEGKVEVVGTNESGELLYGPVKGS